MAESPIKISACYREFGSKLIFGSGGFYRKLLIRKEFWLRGKDLNLRPLGCERDGFTSNSGAGDQVLTAFDGQLIKLDVGIRLQKNQQLASGVLQVIGRCLGTLLRRPAFSGPQPRTDYEIKGLRLNGGYGGYSKSL
jgi:hypothetical protein